MPKHMTPERLMREAIDRSINLTVPWYHMLAYAYYEEDDPLVSDASFDGLAKLMLKHWPEIEHRHKHLISEDDLKAGSLLNRDFPSVVAGAVASVRSLCREPKRRRRRG